MLPRRRIDKLREELKARDPAKIPNTIPHLTKTSVKQVKGEASTGWWRYFFSSHFYKQGTCTLSYEIKTKAALFAWLGCWDAHSFDAFDEDKQGSLPTYNNEILSKANREFEDVQKSGHAWLNYKNRTQINNLLRYYFNNAGHARETLAKYYFAILHSEDPKSKAYKRIDSDAFYNDMKALGLSSLSAATLFYDLRFLTQSSRDEDAKLRNQLEDVRNKIQAMAIAVGRTCKIAELDDLAPSYQKFKVTEQGYVDIEEKGTVHYHLPHYRVCGTPAELKHDAQFARDEKARVNADWWIAWISWLIAKGIALGEGGVAGVAFRDYAEKNWGVPSWLSWIPLLVVFTGGAICNDYLTNDDVSWVIDQFYYGKIYNDEFGDRVNAYRRSMIRFGMIPSTISGVCYGALQWKENSEVVGPVVAAVPATLSAMAFSAIFFLVLAEFIKNNQMTKMARYVRDVKEYALTLACRSPCFAPILVPLYIAFELAKVAINCFLNAAFTVTMYGVLTGSVDELFKGEMPASVVGFIVSVSVITDMVFGARKIQLQMDKGSSHLPGSKTFASDAEVNRPEQKPENSMQKTAQSVGRWVCSVAMFSLLANTAGQVMLNLPEKPHLKKMMPYLDGAQLSWVIAVSAVARSGLPNNNAIWEALGKGKVIARNQYTFWEKQERNVSIGYRPPAIPLRVL